MITVFELKINNIQNAFFPFRRKEYLLTLSPHT